MQSWANKTHNDFSYENYGLEDFGDNMITPTKQMNQWDQGSRHHLSDIHDHGYNRNSSHKLNHLQDYRHARTSPKNNVYTRDRLSNNMFHNLSTNHQLNYDDHPVKSFDEIFDDISQRFDQASEDRTLNNSNLFLQNRNHTRVHGFNHTDVPIRKKPSYIKKN